LDKRSKITVLGAGLSGLAAAYELAGNGQDVTVIEKNNAVGGLARSIKKDGFTFDLGGHRLLINDKEILETIKGLLGEELLTIKRKSRIFLNNKFIHYPLKFPSALFSLGAGAAAKIVASYAGSVLKKKNSKKEPSFEEWIIRNFGEELYKIYFKPYTEKVWGIPCQELSSDWATQRINFLNLFDIIKKTISRSKDKPRTYASTFYYPKGGIGSIAEKLAEKIKNGGEIHLGFEAQEIVCDKNKVLSVLAKNNEKEIDVESAKFISTMPLTELVKIISPKAPDEVLQAADSLKYRSIICIFLTIDRQKITDDHWLYFPDKNLVFSRIHEPKNWSFSLAERGKTSLCLEIFCNKEDEIWNSKDSDLTRSAIDQLEQLRLIDKNTVISSAAKRVSFAYPIFRLGYKEHLNKIKKYLAQFSNLHLIGRTGTFKYINMDHVIKEGLLKAKEIM